MSATREPEQQEAPNGAVMKLRRSIDRWRGCDPYVMANFQSSSAIEFAFADARQDILALHAECERLRTTADEREREAFKRFAEREFRNEEKYTLRDYELGLRVWLGRAALNSGEMTP